MSTSLTHSLRFPILNPNIYLNYLTPHASKQFEIARDLTLATVGALLWDMLVSLPQDLLLAKSGYKPTRMAYFLSRSSAFTYILLSVIMMTHPIVHCTAMQLGATVCWLVASAASTFLLLRRIQTIFHGEKYIQHLFLFLFVVNLGLSTVFPIGVHLTELATTGYCINMSVKPYAVAATYSRLAYDFLVFLAISYKFGTATPASPHGASSTTMGRKDYPRLVRAFLQNGQLYYLIIVCFDLLVAALVMTSSVPPIFQTMFIIPNISLSSSMAARVYRNLELAVAKADFSSSALAFKKPLSTSRGSGTGLITVGSQSVVPHIPSTAVGSTFSDYILHSLEKPMKLVGPILHTGENAEGLLNT